MENLSDTGETYKLTDMVDRLRYMFDPTFNSHNLYVNYIILQGSNNRNICAWQNCVNQAARTRVPIYSNTFFSFFFPWLFAFTPLI